MAGRAFLDRLAADVAKRPKDVEALAKLAGLGAGERGSAFSTKIPPKVLVAAGLNGGDGKAGDGPEVDRLYPEDLPSLCTKMIFAGVRDPDLWGPLEMRLVSLLQQDGGRSFGAAHLALISQAFGSVGASRALSETVERCSQLSLQRDEMSLADLACVLEGLSRASRGCGGRNSHADRGLGGDGEGRRGEFVRCSAQFVSERARTEIGLMAPDLVACLAVGLSKLLQGEGRPLQEKGGEGRLVVEALEAVGDALMEVEEGSSGMSVVEKRFVCRDMALVAGAFASAGVRTARLFEEIGRCAVEGVRREIADGGGRRERDGGIEMSVGLLLTSLFKGNLGERSREQVLRDVAPVIFLRLAPEGSGGGEGGRRDREAAERLGDVEQSSRWSGLGALANGLKRHSAGRTRDELLCLVSDRMAEGMRLRPGAANSSCMKRELSGDKEGALRDAAGRDRERQRGKEGGGERKGPAPRDVAVVADALGTVSLQDSCELNFFCDLPAWCTDSLEDLQEPRDFVAIAVALGRLRIRDSTTLLALVAAASVIMQKCSLQQVASMMTAFARLRFRNTTLLSVCAEKVQTVLCADLGVKAFAEGHAEEAASIKGISEKARQTLSSGSRRIQKRRGRAASPFCPTAHVKSVVPLVSAFGRLEFDAGGLFAIFGDWLVLYSEQTDREEPHGRTMVLREESQTEGLGIDRGGRLGIQEWREILLSFAKVGRVHSGVLERAVSSLEGSCGPDWPNSAFSKEEGSRRSPSSVSSAEKINNKLSIHQQLSVLQALRVLRHPGEGSRLLLEICRGLQSVFGRMPLVVDEKRAGVPGVQLELENVTRALDCLAFLAPSCWHWPPQVLLGEVEGGGERSSSFVWDLLRESGSCLISALEGQRSAAGRLCARRGNHRRESPPLILNGNVGGPDLRTLSQVVVAVSHTLSLFVPSLPSIPPSEVAVSSSSSPGQIPGGSPDTGSPDFLPAVDHLQRLISVALLGLARKRTRTRERTDLIANGNAAALVSSLSALLLLQSHNGMSRKGGFFGSECKNWKNVEDMDCASGEANSHLPQDVETGEVGSRLLEENFGLNFFSDKERGEDSGEGGSWSNNQMGALRSVFPTACAALDVVRVLDVEPHRGVRAALPSEAWSPPGRRGRRRRRKVGEGSSDEDDEDEGEDEWVCDWRSLAGDDVAYPPQRSSSQGRSHPVASDGLLRVQLSKDSEAVRKTLVRLSPPPLSSGSEETAQSSAQADSVAAPGLEKEAPFLRRFGFRLGERIFGRRGGQVSLLSVDFVLPPERER